MGGDGMWAIKEIEQRVWVINRTQHEQTRARPLVFIVSSQMYRRIHIQLYCFHVPRTGGETDRDEEGGRVGSITVSSVSSGREEALIVCVCGCVSWKVCEKEWTSPRACSYTQHLAHSALPSAPYSHREWGTLLYRFISIVDCHESLMTRPSSSLHLPETVCLVYELSLYHALNWIIHSCFLCLRWQNVELKSIIIQFFHKLILFRFINRLASRFLFRRATKFLFAIYWEIQS